VLATGMAAIECDSAQRLLQRAAGISEGLRDYTASQRCNDSQDARNARDSSRCWSQRGYVIPSPRSQPDGVGVPMMGPGASARRSSPLRARSSRQKHCDPAEIISSRSCLIVALIISSTPLRHAQRCGRRFFVGWVSETSNKTFRRSPGLSIGFTTEVTQN